MKHMHFVAAASAITIGLCGASALAQTQAAPDQTGAIDRVVKQCVAAVRAAPSEKGLEGFYRGFDAYYNSLTSKVLNNATTVGDQKPLFVFQKCMSEKGIPLG
ncbi:MAG: hypothetical protein JWO28_3341 [Hyphomicrobiales bacterium]|nr:hypothetical protein [Hyphomicrobiales bacterium]